VKGYVFYCSRCKKDHAGECPPEKSVVKTYLGKEATLSIGGKAIRPITIPTIFSAPISKAYPSLGSRWDVEDWDSASSRWVGRGGGLTYEVVSIDPPNNRVNINHVVTGLKCWMDRAAWDALGLQTGPNRHFRFVSSVQAPALGSEWNAETSNSLGQWAYSNGKYRIASVVGDQVEIEAVGVPSARFKYHVDHWGAAGVADGTGRWLRFVSA